MNLVAKEYVGAQDPLRGCMNRQRRRFFHWAAAAAALPVLSRLAEAQDYPTRPVLLVVGFAPGGSADILGRLMGQWLSERLGQQFVVENRAGAGTNIATEAVVNSTPDGYTLLFITGANLINATLYRNLKFNFMHDIAPVALLAREPGAVVVHPSFPAKSLAEFIAYAKANPGKVTMAWAAMAPHRIFPAKCSRCWPESICCTFRIAAPVPR